MQSSAEEGESSIRLQLLKVTRPGTLSMLISALLVAPGAWSQDVSVASDDDTHKETSAQLSEIVVTATRTPQRAFDVPASADSVPIGSLDEDTPNIDPGEYLRTMPGVGMRGGDIVIRGGLRRRIRIYTDGVPATMPEGTSKFEHFSLTSADRIEVLRGPFSALYGNSADGVVQLFTADGSDPAQVRAGIAGARFGTWRGNAGTRGRVGNMGYNVDVAGYRSDGFRDHDRTKRVVSNGKLTFDLGGDKHLTIVANSIANPVSEGPGALTWKEFKENRRQASPTAELYSEGQQFWQTQVGAVYTMPLTEHQSIHTMFYTGRRHSKNFLGVPPPAQLNPLSSGAITEIVRDYRGLDARWAWDGPVFSKPLTFTAGVSWDDMTEARKGFTNFVGDRVGVTGELRRHERNVIYNVDEYAQGTWHFTPKWSATLGVRHSEVKFRSHDFYVTDENPDDSGHATYRATNPLAGLSFQPNDNLNLYASWGKGFETPTFLQVAYGPGGLGGLNFRLKPSRSRNAELGAKALLPNGASVQAALFQSKTRDEIAVESNVGGRRSYHNVGRSTRRGIELGLDQPLGEQFRLTAAYTYVRARLDMSAESCGGDASCARAGSAQAAGVPHDWVDVKLRWQHPSGWHAAVEVDGVSSTYADDAHTSRAPGYLATTLDGGYTWSGEHTQVAPYVRVDNLFNRHYIDSVAINATGGRSFMPGMPRTIWLGLNVDWDY